MNGGSFVQAVNFVQAIRGPIMLIVLGALVAIDYAGIYGFWRTWPILIIVFGILKLMERAVVKSEPYQGNYPHPGQGNPTSGGSAAGGNAI
jgi:hypothetical protein